MAVPFLYLALSFIFFLPNFCCSCRRTLCGNITIEYPFSLNPTTPPNSPPPSNGLPMVPLQHPNSPPPSNGLPMVPPQHVDDCDGFLTINCNQGQATITIRGHEFVVMDITHSNRVITVQDITLSHEHFRRPCAFFLNFTHPIYDYDLFISHLVEGFRNSPQDCELGFGISQTQPFSLTECGDYSLYYWNELNQLDVNESCKTDQPAFEWKLSYNELNGSFSLLSVGFSQHFQLREDCFNCHVDRKSCTSNKGAVNSSCWCETTCESEDQLPFKKRDGWHSKRTMAIVVGFAGFVLVSLSLALCLYKHKKIRSSILCEKHLNDNQSIEDFLAEYGSVAPKRYTYSQLKKITKAFKEELGQGGYGTVFKGTLIDGHIVAVKMLKESKGNGEEFMNEVASIGRTSHVNIVSLLGFCFEGQKRALVYDFMCNGSLEKLLNTDKPKTILHWEKLHQIAIGIARGLEYLHRGCKTRIVHFDIKPHNILLDQDFCPKISDFGLAKLCLVKDSIISLAGARGTIGYIAPEVFSRNFGVVSSKSDVYSYGMMVLEMAEGKKNPNHSVKNSSEMYFPHWIYEHLQQNQDLLLCGVNINGEETVRKMILVGLWCIQTLPQNRPSMSRVIEMLEGSVNDLQLPPKPYLSSSPFGSVVDASLIQEVSLTDDYSSEIS